MSTHPSFRPRRPQLSALVLSACLAVVTALPASTSAAIWTQEPGAPAGERFPADAPVFTLDRAELATALAAAPEERTGRSAVELSLPMPDGTWERFTVYRSRRFSCTKSSSQPPPGTMI